MASVTVEYWRDEESATWGFRVPALGVTGGGDATRELAEAHCLDAVADALESAPADDETEPGVERSTLDITLTPHSARRLTVRLVPDLDDELVCALGRVEEVLLTLLAWESDPDDPVVLPAPFAGGRALDALHRVLDALAPTQTHTTRTGRQFPAAVGPGRLLGPDGQYEHRPLRPVEIDQADLDLLGIAAGEMGRALATATGGDLAEALTTGAETVSSLTRASAPDPVGIVTGLARALGVLDLAATTTDTTLLASRLDVSPRTDVVLTPTEDAAYARLADRINTMWADGRGLDRCGY